MVALVVAVLEVAVAAVAAQVHRVVLVHLMAALVVQVQHLVFPAHL
jgi:hypothetical protein